MNDERSYVLHDVDKNLNPNNMLQNWYNKAIDIMEQAKTKNEYSRCLCIFNLLYNLDPFFLDCASRIIECKKKINKFDAKFEVTTTTQELKNSTSNKKQKHKKRNQVKVNIAKVVIYGILVFLLAMFIFNL